MSRHLDEDEFFEKHNITDWDELEELPFRFRDASHHYYHKKNDKVYSHNFLRDYWYITPSAEKLRLQHVDPEEYKRQQDEANAKARQEMSDLAKFESQFDSPEQVLKRHTVDGVIHVDKSFVDDIIKNKLYSVCFGSTGGGASLCARFYAFRDPQENKANLFADTVHDTGDSDCPSRMFGLVWDFRAPNGQDLYIEFNGNRTRLYPDAVVPLRYAVYTQIRLTDKDGNAIHNVKYRGIDTKVGYRAPLDEAIFRVKTLICPNGPGIILGHQNSLGSKPN